MQVEFEEQCKLHSEIQKQIQLTKETGASNQVSGMQYTSGEKDHCQIIVYSSTV